MLKSDSPNSIVSQPLFKLREQGQDYLVRSVSWNDIARQDEYQRLRAEVFVQQFGWKVPVDSSGRERDRYDSIKDPTVSVYGVYGKGERSEVLLGGIRIFSLQTWEDSMACREFREAEIIPENVIQKLEIIDCRNILELTRFCLARSLSSSLKRGGFSRSIVRDLLFASACFAAQESVRQKALALVDQTYLKVLYRSHFVIQEIYQGYRVALIMIDTWATVRAIWDSGNWIQAERMLALCDKKSSLLQEIRRLC